ncbi:MAG: hypothetical protein ACFFCQ_00915 [Promethearchaeota archaeon]
MNKFKETSLIKAHEGLTTFYHPPPEPDGVPRKRQTVFYNPRQSFNRDIAILTYLAETKLLGRPPSLCEPFCGTGLRGLRYLIEGNAEEILLNDINPLAVQLTSYNLQFNKNHISPTSNITIRNQDAFSLLFQLWKDENWIDFIDIDPFGSPSRYFLTTPLATKRDGLLSYTATDLPVLTGVYPQKCFSRYFVSNIIRTDFCHEMALRLFIAAAQRQALMHSALLLPQLSFYTDHYIRVVFRRKKGPKKGIYENIGFISFCKKCTHRSRTNLNQTNANCSLCNSKINLIGPLWLGPTCNALFLDKVQEMLNYSGQTTFGSFEKNFIKIERVLMRLKDEFDINVPWHYDLHRLAKHLKVTVPSNKQVIQKLEDSGFKACKTHFSNQSIKTDARVDELSDCLLNL